MSFALLAPLGLAALAALALPLLIHLVRRLELKTTDFAALRWVAERMRPQRRLRFERPWLLLMRLVLLALFALLLARPVWNGDAPPTRVWTVVAPGVALADARAAAGADDSEWHRLAPGFPRMDETEAPAQIATASLLRELDAQLPPGVALTVVVPETLSGLDGEKPRLSRAVEWRVVPGKMPDRPAVPGKPFHLAVRYAAQSEDSLRYLRAAVVAWNQSGRRHCELDAQPAEAPVAETSDALIWLAPSSSVLNRWLDRGGVALAANHPGNEGEPLWRDATGNVLARTVANGHGRLIALPGALTPDQLPMLLDADFPERLRVVLGDVLSAPTQAQAAAMRPTADAATAGSQASRLHAARPLDAWLALLIAAVFLFERVVATWPRTEREA
ncbi:MAG: BatA domain-containing protein [Rudaea sp.]|nr:BatA domain-containing protein [Rudaea sp.]